MWNYGGVLRLLDGGDNVEILVHQDESVYHLTSKGNFISHYWLNSQENGRLRSFTCDTIPFVVADIQDPTNKPKIQVQDLLVDAYLLF